VAAWNESTRNEVTTVGNRPDWEIGQERELGSQTKERATHEHEQRVHLLSIVLRHRQVVRLEPFEGDVPDLGVRVGRGYWGGYADALGS
jgi:hypothetical protein